MTFCTNPLIRQLQKFQLCFHWCSCMVNSMTTVYVAPSNHLIFLVSVSVATLSKTVLGQSRPTGCVYNEHDSPLTQSRADSKEARSNGCGRTTYNSRRDTQSRCVHTQSYHRNNMPTLMFTILAQSEVHVLMTFLCFVSRQPQGQG